MGGKNQQTPPAAPPPPVDNTQQIMQMFMAMSQMQSDAMMQMIAMQPTVPAAPQLTAPQPVDWSAKIKELEAKTKADYKKEQLRKKTRSDTILTSPLLDDEDTTTTESILVDNS